MKISRVGIDLAKNVFQIHAVDQTEKPVLNRQLKRSEMAEYFQQLPPCLIGMEALCRRTLLGAQTHRDGPHGALHCTAVRQTLCAGQQE